jgi:tetratricopeptide (TPR) repeat protein
MNRTAIIFFMTFAAALGCEGCTAKKSSDQQTGAASKQSVKTTVENISGDLYLIGGASQDQANQMALAIQKAHKENEPILTGLQLEEKGDWIKVIGYYEKLLSNKQYQWEAHAGLARAYEALGQYEKAIEHLEIKMKSVADWARPEYEAKLAALKVKAARQNP